MPPVPAIPVVSNMRELLWRHRPAEIIPLCLVALVGPKKCQLSHRLHALSNHAQLEAPGHGDHCGHNGRILDRR